MTVSNKVRLFLLLLIFVTSMSCSSSKDRQAFIDDADRFCEIHKLTSWEQGGRLEALNQLDPTEKLEELTRIIRATVTTTEMQKIIFEKGRSLPAEDFYPFLQQAIPELTGTPFNCPAIPEFYISK
mgnify:CR=1 FL=1